MAFELVRSKIDDFSLKTVIGVRCEWSGVKDPLCGSKRDISSIRLRWALYSSSEQGEATRIPFRWVTIAILRLWIDASRVSSWLRTESY